MWQINYLCSVHLQRNFYHWRCPPLGVMSKINNVYAEMERLTVNELNSSRKASLTSSTQAHHVVKAKFDERA